MFTPFYLIAFALFSGYAFSKSLAKRRRPLTNKIRCMYTFERFQELPVDLQIDQLGLHGIPLDLACCLKSSEAVLFAYRDFYIEMVVAKHTDDILCINCFKNLDMLEPYLQQVDIGEINALLLCTR